MQERWFKFANEYKGKRFKKNGITRDKFEMFAAIERGEVKLMDLENNKSGWSIIKSFYHVGSIHKKGTTEEVAG